MAQTLFIAAVIPHRYAATWPADKIGGAGSLSLLADEGYQSIDKSLHSLLRNNVELVRRSRTGLSLCGRQRYEDLQGSLVVTHPNGLM